LIRIMETAEQAFAWVPDVGRLKEISRTQKGKILLVEGLHPMVTDPVNRGHGAREWTKGQVMKSAYTAIGKGLNIHHVLRLNPAYQHVVLDGEFNDLTETAEYVVYEEDPEILRLIREEYITKVSMQGDPRRNPVKCDKCGTSECRCREVPEGVIFGSSLNESMAYVITKDDATYYGKPIPKAPPGDWNTSVRIVETNNVMETVYARYPQLREASDCIQACIESKVAAGKEIDDQALAICYSECGAKEISSNTNNPLTKPELTAITRENLAEMVGKYQPKVKEAILKADSLLKENNLKEFNEALAKGDAFTASMILQQNSSSEQPAVDAAKIAEQVDVKIKETVGPILKDITELKTLKDSMGNLSKQVQETATEMQAIKSKSTASVQETNTQPAQKPKEYTVEQARQILQAHIR